MSPTPQRSRTQSGTAFVEAGAGEPLVLIHGVGMRLEAWAPQMAALSRTHRIVALDMPGHGESAPLAEGSALPAFVAWLARVLDELRIEAANVAGHSMGALIAGGAAATLGSRVRRVALLNGVYRRTPDAREAVLHRAREIAAGGVDLEAPLRRWFGDDPETEDAYRLTRGWLSGVDPAGYATAYAAFAGGDETYADAWADVHCPALFMTGDGDPNSTPAMAEAMAEAAPRGEAVTIRGHRHMVNLTAPDEVNGHLVRWLQR
ncbi:alpha/beta fold hydrolase [uncultured Aureimonas sp.]|uniref:alpha/beta fold hydrolase n=1 Tax=uncultured Aureimonas sp. TaxID=1604662 RepID=UPI0025CC7D52|nr:alpha/beta fold hydrolase [uncultured Aureimonas sp.]